MHPGIHRTPASAFTLVELLVAMGITLLTLALLTPFFIFNLRSMFHGEQKLLVNHDVRALTNEMAQKARGSSYFVVYQSFHERQSAGGALLSRDANRDGFVTELDRRFAGDAGDFLVLVYVRDNALYDSRFYDSILGNEPVHQTEVLRVVGYWVAPNREPPPAGQTGPRLSLYRFDTDAFKAAPDSTSWSTPWGVTFPATLSGSTTLESLLPPDTEDMATSPRFAEIVAHNLAGRAAGGLNFLNFANKTVVVQSSVLHGNRAKRVTNTYNLAITPRG